MNVSTLEAALTDITTRLRQGRCPARTSKCKLATVFNEEQLKNTIILPLLHQIGFPGGDLGFEQSFTIQLGRGVYTVRGEPAATASGRLDILCTLDGDPLMVVELKAPSVELTDDDRRQGLSYARLLEKIAPFVLVSNGTQSILYDSYTGKTFQGAYDRLGPSLDEEIRLRFEGLKHFVGYSCQNLLGFCKSHNNEVLSRFRANKADKLSAQINYKYIPAVYVPREPIEAQFREFLCQDANSVFAIFGASGVGKTNVACRLLESLTSLPVLFFSGSTIGSSFMEEVAADFNLTFSPQEQPISILKKLTGLAELHRLQFIFIFDAIDEWIAADKVQQLDQLARVTKRLGIKLCVSCKDTAWQHFLARNGIQTEFAASLYHGGCTLQNFSPKESEAAVARYTKHFRLKPSKAHNLLLPENPFELRVASEVALLDGVPLRTSRDSRKTLSRYLTLKLLKAASPETSERTLTRLAQEMYTLGQIQLQEDDARRALGLSTLGEMPSDLFSLGFLYRYVSGGEDVYQGFYFSTLRDYLVSVRVLKLHHCTGEVRSNLVARALANSVGESATIYFCRTGSAEEQLDCISGAILSDQGVRTGRLARLFSWCGGQISLTTKRRLAPKIVNSLKELITNGPSSYVLADQVMDTLESLGSAIDRGRTAMEFLELISQYPDRPYTYMASRLASVLRKDKRLKLTRQLVNLATNRTRDGYVRRYVIEALSGKAIPGRRRLFIQLIKDPDPNVRHWVRPWYNDLEDRRLRDELLQMFDRLSKGSVAADIATTLSGSVIEGTAQRLHQRFRTRKYPPNVSAWLCRAIADLGYQPAIPDFLKKLENPRTPKELKDHLVIALGEMDAREAIPVLTKNIEGARASADLYWIARTFSKIAQKRDYERLVSMLKHSKNTNAVFGAALIVAMAHKSQYASCVFKLINEKRFGVRRRVRLLQEWYSNKQPPPTSANSPQSSSASNQELEMLYDALAEGSDLSPMAFGCLLNVESNALRLAGATKIALPAFKSPFSTRSMLPENEPFLQVLAPLLRPWLNDQIKSGDKRPVFLESCVELACLLGDLTTLESIIAARDKLGKALGLQRVERTEHLLRSSDRPVRLRPW
jgi:hypothetical protein